jgi:LL-diaminopimelate aminotransferase
MTKLNDNYTELSDSYVFRQVNEKAAAYSQQHPDQPIYKMGVGNTTRPLAPSVVAALHDAVDRLSNEATYSGYGDELGESYLREALSRHYEDNYGVSLTQDEFVLSDGAKSDTANFTSLFQSGSTVAVPDPVYPVYVESNTLLGNRIVYMPCNEENNFVPAPPSEPCDIIYLCSPNNPTGTVATHEQLQAMVDYALANDAVIIFDAAYSAFIRDSSLPRSIFEIEGARRCAVEMGSFSKMAGFCGVRLAWTAIPRELTVGGVSLLERWRRRQLAMFNGPSNIAQAGGLAVLSAEGQRECTEIIDHYLANARLILDSLESAGLTVYGGNNSPYIWAKAPNGASSWDFFDELLENTQVVTTPGAGFGPEGEGFIRVSAFASSETTKPAMQRVSDYLARR